jgi:outer membrane protein OmpA-like peptidoglycan-associated protein
VVRDLLISLGIEADRIETVSYGEDRPVVPNAASESDHQQNRRAEFLLGPRK